MRGPVQILRAAMLDLLARGHELIPMNECEGFDPKTGCPGHREDAEVTDGA